MIAFAKTLKQPARVLVVENNVDDSDLLVRQLNRNNFQGCIEVIQDGKQVWDLLSTDSRPDLIAIFIDLNLPSLGGVALLRKIRSQNALCKIPVFIMTSSNDPDEIDECSRLGIEGYMAKPVSVLVFTKAIADLFHSTKIRNYNWTE